MFYYISNPNRLFVKVQKNQKIKSNKIEIFKETFIIVVSPLKTEHSATLSLLCFNGINRYTVYTGSFTQWSKVRFFLLQNVQLQQENAELRNELVSVQEQTEVTQQAIRDRDDAIAK